MDEVDLGYRFIKEYWGRGIATESAITSINFGFFNLNLDKIIAMVLPENTASIRVLEKLNFNFENEIIEEGQFVKVYSLYKE